MGKGKGGGKKVLLFRILMDLMEDGPGVRLKSSRGRSIIDSQNTPLPPNFCAFNIEDVVILFSVSFLNTR